MDMGTVGWIALGWFAVALVISLALGGFLHKVNEVSDEEDFAVDASGQKVVRYLRGRKSANARRNTGSPRVRELGKHATG
jgi:hypothetical protein